MSQLDDVITKLAGDRQESDVESVDAVFVEKLASAVDFIVDGFGRVETDTPVQEDSAQSGAADALRARLLEKRSARAKAEEVVEETTKVSSTVLSRLLKERAETKTAAAAAPAEVHHQEEIADTGDDTHMAPSNEDVGDTAEAGGTLAEVLTAALGTGEQDYESAPEGVETGDVHGSDEPIAGMNAVERMKTALMAQVGTEEV